MEARNFLDITALAALLKEKDSDEESDSDDQRQKNEALNPGAIGSPGRNDSQESSAKKKSMNSKENPKSYGDNKNIWTTDEIDGSRSGNFRIPDVSTDSRKRPEVRVQYKQDVKTEDVYLGSYNATPSSSSCDWLTVKIEMPGEIDSSKFQLDLKDDWIELRSTIYILVYVLPHRIDPRNGTAKWNSDKATLTLTLKILRDLDAFKGLI